ncbi:MAG: hypothetical protein WBB45_10240 [Cyclobacteriaceae bacterium]
MKFLLAITFTFLMGATPLFSQSIKVGAGIVLSEETTYETPIDLDSIVFYQRPYKGSNRLILSIRYQYPISKLLSLSAGFQTHGNGAGLTIEKRGTDTTNFNKKLTTAGITEFEFPIAASYSFVSEGSFDLMIFGGLIPIVNKINFDPIYEEGPQYPASVAEGLNKAGTLPKRFHMDYQVGGRLSYKRFNVDVYYQSNLTSNLNNNLEIWGSEFLFKRNTESVRLILSYSIPLFQN